MRAAMPGKAGGVKRNAFPALRPRSTVYIRR